MTRQPTPGVYENYQEPGEFGEGATVRRAEPTIDYRTCGTAELAAANPNVMSYVKEREDEIERLNRHIEELQAKINPDANCACSYDDAGQVCMVHSPLLQKAHATLRKIAAYDDAAANAHLRATGSYGGFDEPGAVEMARGVLEGKDND